MPTPSSRSKKAAAQNTQRWQVGIVLTLIAVALFVFWEALFPGPELQTSTLKTTFNRLSSTDVEFVIPEPGKLRINAGPSTFLDDATVFAVVLASREATPVNTAPFQVSAAFETIFNLVDPDDPTELQLAVVFSEGQFSNQEGTLAELPFSTSLEGQFEIRGIYFGSLPANDFPPLSRLPHLYRKLKHSL